MPKKLNPLHVQNHIEILIDKLYCPLERGFKVVLLDNQIQIVARNKITPADRTFLEFTEDDIRKGFTSGQWNKILNRAVELINEGVLWQQHLKL